MAVSVTLPEKSPPWTIAGPLVSAMKMPPVDEKVMSPELTTSSPSTLAEIPPIWRGPKLATLMPPVLVSASMKLIWVSIPFPGVPMPVAALITRALAMMSAGASAPPSMIDPFDTRVDEGVAAQLIDDDRSGDWAALVRLPTVTLAVVKESRVLKIRFTPAYRHERDHVGRMEEVKTTAPPESRTPRCRYRECRRRRSCRYRPR